MKLVGYVRVSTDAQAENGYGLAVQEKAIRTWARKHGHRLIEICRDEGVSGSNGIEDREGLPQALEVLRAGKAAGLIVARLDRLARSLTVQEAILAMVWQLGGTLVAVDMGGEVPPDDPDDPMRTAMRQMAGVFAELDRRLLVKRLRDARQTKRDRGGYAVGAPGYGQRAEGGQLVADDAEAETIQRAKTLRSQGLSLRAIAAVLTEEGRRPKRGSTWHANTVAQVLRR